MRSLCAIFLVTCLTYAGDYPWLEKGSPFVPASSKISGATTGEVEFRGVAQLGPQMWFDILDKTNNPPVGVWIERSEKNAQYKIKHYSEKDQKLSIEISGKLYVLTMVTPSNKPGPTVGSVSATPAQKKLAVSDEDDDEDAQAEKRVLPRRRSQFEDEDDEESPPRSTRRGVPQNDVDRVMQMRARMRELQEMRHLERSESWN